MEKDFLVIDFEFTQYRKQIGRPRGFFSEIIEIGAVKVSANFTVAQEKIEEFVKPHFYPKQAKESMEFCSITEADMKKAIDFKDMLDKITNLYTPNETWFVAWGQEDYKVLEESCRRHGVDNPVKREDYLDLAEEARNVLELAQTPGLIKTAETLEIKDDGHWHAAYADAVVASKILLRLCEKHEISFDKES